MVMGFYKKIYRFIVLERNWVYKIFKNLMGMEYFGFFEEMVFVLYIVKGM